jgi:hypothetical protein
MQWLDPTNPHLVCECLGMRQHYDSILCDGGAHVNSSPRKTLVVEGVLASEEPCPGWIPQRLHPSLQINLPPT